MLALPELCVTGYTCGDLFCSDSLLDAAEDALVTAAENTGDLLALVGAPVRFGNRLYSCAVAMNRGKSSRWCRKYSYRTTANSTKHVISRPAKA